MSFMRVQNVAGALVSPKGIVATLLWPSVRVKPNTWKKLGLESSGTPENSEDNSKDQNTSHWVFLVSLERS